MATRNKQSNKPAQPKPVAPAEQPKAEQAKPEVVRPEFPRYDSREAKVVEKDATLHYDPDWKYANAVFVAGSNSHVGPTTVMGIIRGLAVQAGEAGLTGSELVTGLRTYPWPPEARSKYCVGSAEGAFLPPIGWSEDYVAGALRKGHVALKSPPPAKAEDKPKVEDKPKDKPKAEDKPKVE